MTLQIPGFPGLRGSLPEYVIQTYGGEISIPLADVQRCDQCAHFSRPGCPSGDCRRFPTWVHVDDATDHFCGEFACERSVLRDLVAQEEEDRRVIKEWRRSL